MSEDLIKSPMEKFDERLRTAEQVANTLRELFEQNLKHQQQLLDRLSMSMYGNGTEHSPGVAVRLDRIERHERSRALLASVMAACIFITLGCVVTATIILTMSKLITGAH